MATMATENTYIKFTDTQGNEYYTPTRDTFTKYTYIQLDKGIVNINTVDGNLNLRQKQNTIGPRRLTVTSKDFNTSLKFNTLSEVDDNNEEYLNYQAQFLPYAETDTTQSIGIFWNKRENQDPDHVNTNNLSLSYVLGNNFSTTFSTFADTNKYYQGGSIVFKNLIKITGIPDPSTDYDTMNKHYADFHYVQTNIVENTVDSGNTLSILNSSVSIINGIDYFNITNMENTEYPSETPGDIIDASEATIGKLEAFPMVLGTYELLTASAKIDNSNNYNTMNFWVKDGIKGEITKEVSSVDKTYSWISVSLPAGTYNNNDAYIAYHTNLLFASLNNGVFENNKTLEYPYVKFRYKTNLQSTQPDINVTLKVNNSEAWTTDTTELSKYVRDSSGSWQEITIDLSKYKKVVWINATTWTMADIDFANDSLTEIRIKFVGAGDNKTVSNTGYFDIDYIGHFKTLSDANSYVYNTNNIYHPYLYGLDSKLVNYGTQEREILQNNDTLSFSSHNSNRSFGVPKNITNGIEVPIARITSPMANMIYTKFIQSYNGRNNLFNRVSSARVKDNVLYLTFKNNDIRKFEYNIGILGYKTTPNTYTPTLGITGIYSIYNKVKYNKNVDYTKYVSQKLNVSIKYEYIAK